MAYLDDPETQRANLRFIKKSMSQPLLSRDDEFDLATRWRDAGDERALHELIRAYTRLVVAIAARFRFYGLPMGDLVQEGNVGLMQAAARFDPDRDVRFSTYATWWIKSAIQDFILRNWSIVRTGTTAAQKSLFFNMRRLRSRIEEQTGRPLGQEGREKIAAELNVALGDVEAMEQRLGGNDQSLNTPIGDESGTEPMNLLVDLGPSPEQVVIGTKDAQARSRWLAAALSELSERERTIINQRRLTENGVTLEELGRMLGVSKERVRQLECRALTKLKTLMLSHVERPSDLLQEQ
jgi:RNA polymerase sigma-32 factor